MSETIRYNGFEIETTEYGYFKVTKGWAYWVVFKDLRYIPVTGARDELDSRVLKLIKILVEEEGE